MQEAERSNSEEKRARGKKSASVNQSNKVNKITGPVSGINISDSDALMDDYYEMDFQNW